MWRTPQSPTRSIGNMGRYNGIELPVPTSRPDPSMVPTGIAKNTMSLHAIGFCQHFHFLCRPACNSHGGVAVSMFSLALGQEREKEKEKEIALAAQPGTTAVLHWRRKGNANPQPILGSTNTPLCNATHKLQSPAHDRIDSLSTIVAAASAPGSLN